MTRLDIVSGKLCPSLSFDYNISNQPNTFTTQNDHRSYSFEYVLIKDHQLFFEIMTKMLDDDHNHETLYLRYN